MTTEEAKKAGFRTASGALYVYWCIENGHIYVRSCDACALTGNDFPTREKAREALRRRKMEVATKREEARVEARKAAGTHVPPPTPSETPAEKEHANTPEGGNTPVGQLTDEAISKMRYGEVVFLADCSGGVSEWKAGRLHIGVRHAYRNRGEAEVAAHKLWLEVNQSQTTPITPEQAKGLRITDTVFAIVLQTTTERHIDGIDIPHDIGLGVYFWTRAAAQAALDKAKDKAKHKPCDMPDEITFNGAGYRRLADNEQHKDGDIPVDGSQTHRFGSIWYRPVESHETPVGETQAKEVVTDEKQDKEPVKWTTYDESDTLDCNLITPEWRAWKVRQDIKESNKEPVAPVEVIPTNASESVKLSNKSDAVSHPSHYTSHPSGVECITITKHMNFCRGNAVKYLWRAGQKGDSIDKEIEDIAKAEEYCRIEKERLIAKKGAK